MPITVVCQGIVRFDKESGQYVRCGTEFQAPDSLAGKSTRCPGCGDDVAVPKSAPTVARAPADSPARTAAPAPAHPSIVASRPSPPTPPWTQAAPPSPPTPPSRPTPPSMPAQAPLAVVAAEPRVEPGDDAPIWLPDEVPSAPEPRTPNPFAPQHVDSDDYSLSPAEETTRPTSVLHPLAAAANVYQLGEADEAPERSVHSGWCDRCGHDIPDSVTICPKCGYQHGMAHVVFRKEPTLPPAMQVCASCNAKLAPGVLLCEACGYHAGLKQHFPALAKQQGPITAPPPTGLDRWVSRQIDGGPSPKNSMLWVIAGVGIFIGLGALTLAGLMFLIFGPWALCMLIPVVVILAVTAALFFAQHRKNAKGELDRQRKGLEAGIWNGMLFAMRALGWRSPAPPFTRFRALDVRNTGFGDNDLDAMQNRNDFEALDLEGTQLTDASLPYMAAMPRLKYLCVRKTKVTEQGAWNLQRAKADLWLWH